ncbi:MAG TPA: hypothetical protein VGE59_03160 [Patescibacteria group bacterium]
MAHRTQVHRMPKIIRGGRIESERPKPSRKSFGLLFIGLAVVVGYWFLFMSDTFAVQKVEVAGAESPSITSVAEALKGRNIFRLTSVSIEQDIRQSYPPTDSVLVVRGLPNTVRLTVSLREPALQWQAGEALFILDSQGEAFEQGTTKPEYAALPKIIDRSNRPVSIGQQIVTPAYVTFVQDINKRAPDLFKRAHVANEILETTFHIDIVLEGDLRIRVTTQRPLEEQLLGAASIYTAHPDAKTIDVRVPKRGYYKK